MEEDPDDPGHRHGLAQALMAQDKYAEALEQYKKLTELEPGTSENYLRMAQLYRRLGQFDKAEASLLRAKQLAPGSLEVLYNEALLYEDQGRYDDAVKVLSDAIAGMKSQSSGAESGRRSSGATSGETIRTRWRSFTSSWATRTGKQAKLPRGNPDLRGNGQAGADAQKRAEML